MMSGKLNTLDVPITPDEYLVGVVKHGYGAHIQHAFPSLSAEYREFLLSGTTPNEWREMFGSIDEEDEDSKSMKLSGGCPDLE